MSSDLSKAEALSIYRKLLLIRLSEEKIREIYPSDQIKTPVHLGIGGEAMSVGVIHALGQRSASFFGTYRNHALYLALTGDTDGFFAELYGKATGVTKGKGGSMHLANPQHRLMATSAVVGTTIPLAVGAAFANQYKQSNDLAVVFFGDGAMEEGVFWESLNFACLHHLKILFVCEDNHLAIHAPASARRGFRSVLGAIDGFRCHALSGNGSSLSTVLTLTREALARMEQLAQPAFLHFTYFRFLEHVGPSEDFNAGYRPQPSAEEKFQLDPVSIFQSYLLSAGCSSLECETIQKEIKDQIAESALKAQAAPFPSPHELLTDILA